MFSASLHFCSKSSIWITNPSQRDTRHKLIITIECTAKVYECQQQQYKPMFWLRLWQKALGFGWLSAAMCCGRTLWIKVRIGSLIIPPLFFTHEWRKTNLCEVGMLSEERSAAALVWFLPGKTEQTWTKWIISLCDVHIWSQKWNDSYVNDRFQSWLLLKCITIIVFCSISV